MSEINKKDEGINGAIGEFPKEVHRLCGVNPNLCIQCMGCTGVCPFAYAMDYPPHKILRLIQLGCRDQVLNASSIWICVSCHSCSNQCPQALDIVSLMDSLRETALDERRRIPEQDILLFHRAVLESIEHHGRTHKLEIVLRYKASTWKWLEDLDVGLKMLARRKLDLTPSKVSEGQEIKDIFARTWEP